MSGIEALIGIALLAIGFLLLRRLAPRPDGSQQAFIQHLGAAMGIAVVFTATFALGAGLIIHGGMALW